MICYLEFGAPNQDGLCESAVRLPKCRHIFGDNCLRRWLQESARCPYCRDRLPSNLTRAFRSSDVFLDIMRTRGPLISEQDSFVMPSPPWPARIILTVLTDDRMSCRTALRVLQHLQHASRRVAETGPSTQRPTQARSNRRTAPDELEDGARRTRQRLSFPPWIPVSALSASSQPRYETPFTQAQGMRRSIDEATRTQPPSRISTNLPSGQTVASSSELRLIAAAFSASSHGGTNPGEAEFGRATRPSSSAYLPNTPATTSVQLFSPSSNSGTMPEEYSPRAVECNDWQGRPPLEDEDT